MPDDNVNSAVLAVENLHVDYFTRGGTVSAVRDVSFEIKPGEIFGLVGESGSGKSTIAMALMNYLGQNGRATGSISFNGTDILRMSQKQLRRIRGSDIAMVYQNPMSSLNPSIPVGDQIGEPLRIHQRMSRQGAFERAVEMMEKTQIPDPEVNAHRYPHQLSGGMQQRAVISMALINNPDLLILDEPTTGLDVTTEATVLDLVRDLRDQFQTAILFITHDLGVIAQVSERVGVMYAGELVETRETQRLFARPRHPYSLALMATVPRVIDDDAAAAVFQPIPGRLPDLQALPQGCVFAPRCAFARERCTQEPPPLFDLGEESGRAACFYWDTLPAPQEFRAQAESRQRGVAGDVLIDASDIKIHFEERTFWDVITRTPPAPVRAVDGLSITLHKGETVGLVGESGSGKTTFGKTLVQLNRPTGGALTFDGKTLSDLSKEESSALHKDIQFVFQNPESSLNPRKRVGDIIARPLRLYDLAGDKQISERVSELLEMVQLRPEYAQRLPHELSGGEKQRVAIARAFAAEPELVVADEPLSALDVSVQASILNLLIRLQETFGTTYLFISHDLNTVRSLCDRVVVMYLGNLAEVGPVNDVFRPPYHPYTEALISAIPVINPEVTQHRIRLEGSVPSPRNPPSGCKFHTRCPRKLGAICEQEAPPGQTVREGHTIYCHRPLEDLQNEIVFVTPSPSSEVKSGS